jgi:membrane protein implicated in regulation of membrane protease activity
LQGVRSSTIAEAAGRATMFLGAVPGGLVALGVCATATDVGAAFYTLELILLSTLAFVELMTFDRVLRSGIEDHGNARRIGRLRGVPSVRT